VAEPERPTQRLFRFLADLGPLWDSIDPDFELHDHDIPDAGVLRGPDGLMEWVARFGEAWESASLEAEEYIEAGGKLVVVARLRAKGKGSGVALERVDGIVCRERDGKLVRIDYYGSKEEALAAAGLAADR
jgi:ketosteroid isomerase-like protein